MIRPIALALALAPLAAQADEVATHLSDRGDGYHVTSLEGGVTLESWEPVTYHWGAAAQRVEGIETITLRPDCTALSSLHGEGGWSRDATGVLMSFRGPVYVGFPGFVPQGIRGCLAR
jgi:hypothetical protein